MTYIPPPDVSGVGKNWYTDTTTAGTATPLTQYNASVVTVNSTQGAYTTAYNNLNNALLNPA